MTHDKLAGVRLAMAAMPRGREWSQRAVFTLGDPAVDARLGGGLERAALHEIVADAIDGATACGFVAALAQRAMGAAGELIWARGDVAGSDAGDIHGPGLVDLGLDPGRLSLLSLRTTADILRAGSEAARCSSLCAAVLEIHARDREADLTATRRLALAAEKSGVTLFLLRLVSHVAPSAAMTRWTVRSSASRPLPGGAPGHPAFDAALVRHRGGAGEARWRVEWDRDRRVFSQALSGPLVSLPAGRPAAARVAA